MYGTAPTFDLRDQEILDTRAASLDENPINCGEFVIFADGTLRRVSHIWDFPEGDWSIQTSAGGSFYLGNGYVSFSGSLYNGVPLASLWLTDETRDGSVWFFHHDWAMAHNGVHSVIPFRVWSCDLEPTR